MTPAALANCGADALGIRSLSKRFGGALALDNVSLSIRRGEVHGLLGSNGSGKSTLIKILSGFHTPDAGAELQLYGKTLPLPVKSSQLNTYGLSFVHQHLGLVPTLSVTENLYLGRIATENNWRINWTIAHQNARAVFDRFELDLDPTVVVATLSPVQQALLAIVRAYETLRDSGTRESDRPGVLVLDEPTPFLPQAGVAQLFDLIRQCVSTGASVIFVSHDIDEVREITDRATILRDGRLIDTVITSNTSHEAFVSAIIGRDLEAYGSTGKPVRGQSVQLAVDKLCFNRVGPLSFDLAKGEILGLTGLIGSGFDNVPALLYGAAKGVSGSVTMAGHTHNLAQFTPENALQHGVAYLPADRLGEAGVGSLSVADNISLPVLSRLSVFPGLTDKQINAHAIAVGARAGVKPNNPSMPLAALSGGNAQKALMGKWLQINPDVLLLDEPTQGVDVGARKQIWDSLDQLAATGAAVLIGSTDYEQLATVCHRVLIFSQGQIVATLSGADLTKELIAEYCYRSMTRSA
ncbi:hypothetical protein AB833_31235 [Chromatiales bacterium (ex Bugula neritina AB1)]|nr:hypothetical protein AB833_31235 [Chromatiales bacterium (ex Bugula neritina AB1)]